MVAGLPSGSMTLMKKLMKHGMVIGGTILLLAAKPVLAADTNTYNQDDRYRAHETSLDLFGTAAIGQQTINHITGIRANRDVALGAGAGMNYFLTRNFGFGAEAYSQNIGHSFIDNASASLIGRFPLGLSGFAPYVYGGGGYQFDPNELWFAHVGAGIEYRFTRNIGAFVDARYVLTDGTRNYGLGRAGVRFAF